MNVNGASERDDERDNRLPSRRSGGSKPVSKESFASMETPRSKPQAKLRQKARLQKPAQIEQKNKLCEFHGDKGHSMDECIHLRKQIEEAVKSGQLSHRIKELKQGANKGEHEKAAKKGNLQQRKSYGKLYGSTLAADNKVISHLKLLSKSRNFLPTPCEKWVQETPIVIKAEVEGHLIHRIYVDGGSASEVLYEHCFNRLHSEVKSSMIPATAPLLGFSGKISWPLGQI
ncbi:hypothetical protein Tco_0266042 [Tanacetum coccineum]